MGSFNIIVQGSKRAVTDEFNIIVLQNKERRNMMNFKDVMVAAAFFFELYHSLAHLTVLTGYRMLPRKDLVRAKQYFIIDAACAAIAYAIHQADYFYFILILQQWQHIFYYSTWDKSAAAKRVISWSSLDWNRGRWNQLDLVLGTAFDLSVHLANTYFLGAMMTFSAQLVAGLTALILYEAIIHRNKTLAWSSPSNIPDWVARRIKPLSEEQVQPVAWMENLQMK